MNSDKIEITEITKNNKNNNENATFSNFMARNIATRRFSKVVLEESDPKDVEKRTDKYVDCQIIKNIELLPEINADFALVEKLDYGTSGYLTPETKKWNEPTKIFKIGSVEKLENFLNNLKFLHPNKEANAYIGRSGYIPSGERLSMKHPKGCSYICLNFSTSFSRQSCLHMSSDMFYITLKGLILALASNNFPNGTNKKVYDSICCIESLCKVHRTSRNRKSLSLKIWKLNEFDNLTVLDHIVKIFQSKEFFHCNHIQYFASVIEKILGFTNGFKDTLKDTYERHVQRNKFNKMNEEELQTFKNACEPNLHEEYAMLINNPLVGIKIKNYTSS